MARKERKQDKAERREQRKAEKAERAQSIEDGEDPDLAGIKPGPQPLPEQFHSIPGEDQPPDEQS